MCESCLVFLRVVLPARQLVYWSRTKIKRVKDYGAIKDIFRPAHADYTYQNKYGIRDYRGGGRSSARETTMRVAAGAIAKKYLQEQNGILIQGYLSAIGHIKPEPIESKYS